MGRCGLIKVAVLTCLAFGMLASLAGCSGSNPVNLTNFPVPANIALSPAPTSSMEIGTNQAFSATPLDVSGNAITEPITYQSSNTAVVTIAANGLACAGSWDSLSSPQICTPGSVGVARITATTQGVTSPASTVYVHQKVDKVTVSAFIPPNSPPPGICQSIGQNANPNAYYEARAYSRGHDITPTVGQFTFQALNAAVATISNTAGVLANMVNGVSLNQIQVTAKVPGITPIFARSGNNTSTSANFETCRVESIGLEITTQTPTSATITPTVIDILGYELKNAPLTWSSSQSASVSVSDTGLATTAAGRGSATITASCTPPTCNVGFLPTQPIYPENAVLIVPASGQSGSGTVYVSSTGCGTTDDCFSVTIPITTPANTLGTVATLPATPNSLVFNRQGNKAFFGTDSGLLGSRGLGVLETGAGTVSQFTAAPGKVLAVSPDGNTVIISDTVDTPNQVFIFNPSTNATTPLRITGATAADFSPDNLKAYIVAGSTLYVFSKLDALKTLSMGAPANDVSFLSEGAFAYVAGGSANAVSVWWTCNPGKAAPDIATPGTPTFIRTLPDASGLIAVDPPTVDIIHATASPKGCIPDVTNTVTSFDLGHSNFVAKQLIVSQDGTKAYILTPSLTSILVFNIAAETSSAIALTGDAVPLGASLSPDGAFLYVGTDDGTLHVLQTATGGDIAQIPFPTGLCQTSAGQPFPGLTCNPDLVAVKP
jgi:hypothetical protein